MGDWINKTDSFCEFCLYLLRLDFANAKCGIDCCRAGFPTFEMLGGAGGVKGVNQDMDTEFVNRVKLLVTPDEEHGDILKVIRDSRSLPQTPVSFVDTLGCTCKVCSVRASALFPLGIVADVADTHCRQPNNWNELEVE